MIDKILARISNTPAHRRILKLHKALFPFPKEWIDAEGQAANDLIRETLESPEPCLIGKFGSIELESVIAYLYKDKFMLPWERLYRYMSGDVRYKGWDPTLLQKLSNNAGFFSIEEPYLSDFAKLYLSIMPDIDILQSWQHAEILLKERIPETMKIRGGINPWMFDNPWTQALKNKRVLIIHPFINSIQTQYKKRKLLFPSPDILPAFKLLSLKTVQSEAGEKVPFSNWFEALDSMKKQINQIDFDIALIGAGAYGLPLGSHVKSNGKKAVHLGGATQILFGVYGERWIQKPDHKNLINEYWIRPLAGDRIKNYKTIEKGCYW